MNCLGKCLLHPVSFLWLGLALEQVEDMGRMIRGCPEIAVGAFGSSSGLPLSVDTAQALVPILVFPLLGSVQGQKHTSGSSLNLSIQVSGQTSRPLTLQTPMP